MNTSFSLDCSLRGFLLALALVCTTAELAARDGLGRDSARTSHSFESLFGQTQTDYPSIEACMAAHDVPGLSLAVLHDGRLAWAKGYGLTEVNGTHAVDTQTVFSVGSVSKLVTAVITLRIVQAGQLNLDQDVNRFLTRWQVPATRFTARQPVTLRHIMSHTAGFTVHGFPDFQPGATLPSVLDTLNGRPPARHGAVVVDFEPGSKYRYSGGGTTVQTIDH